MPEPGNVVLWLNAQRPKIRTTDAWVAVIMDAVWVVGSCALILVVPFSVGGKWLVALLAELVLAFAILQWLGSRKIRKERSVCLALLGGVTRDLTSRRQSISTHSLKVSR